MVMVGFLQVFHPIAFLSLESLEGMNDFVLKICVEIWFRGLESDAGVRLSIGLACRDDGTGQSRAASERDVSTGDVHSLSWVR